jgi:hypothetical protein
VAAEALATFASLLYNSSVKTGKRLQPVILLDLPGKGPVRQRSLSADLIFWLLLYQDKSNSQPEAIERVDAEIKCVASYKQAPANTIHP